MSESKRKLAVITGASRGIGKALVLAAAREGMDVAFCSRNKNNLTELQEELKNKFPEISSLAIVCDVRSSDQLKAFAKKVISGLGTPHLLVNNAGSFLPGNIIDEKEENLLLQIETNLYSAYRCTRNFLKPMIEKASGHIFNMCSVASLKAYPGGGSYSISKFALYGFSQSLREELKPHGIRVTSVLPGATLTDSWAGTDLPESRFMPAEDIADAVINVYQLSERTVVEDLVLRPLLGDI